MFPFAGIIFFCDGNLQSWERGLCLGLGLGLDFLTIMAKV